MNSNKLIIFDFDGTIAPYPLEYTCAEAERIFKLHNWEIPSREILKDCFADFDFFRFVEDHELLDLELVYNAFFKHFNHDNLPKAQLFEKTIEILSDLENSAFEIALATARNCSQEDMIIELCLSESLPFFSSIQCRLRHDEDFKDKSPQIKRILKELNIKPQNAILVGDTPSDVTSAKNVGLRASVAVLSGGIRREILEREKPDYLLNDISELPEVLKEW